MLSKLLVSHQAKSDEELAHERRSRNRRLSEAQPSRCSETRSSTRGTSAVFYLVVRCLKVFGTVGFPWALVQRQVTTNVP
jgi:hypothetical protein